MEVQCNYFTLEMESYESQMQELYKKMLLTDWTEAKHASTMAFSREQSWNST